jgi:hypothetical protein
MEQPAVVGNGEFLLRVFVTEHEASYLQATRDKSYQGHIQNISKYGNLCTISTEMNIT